MMSRLAGFYIAKAVESAAGSPTTAASCAPARRTDGHAALDTIRTHDRNPAILPGGAAAMHHIIGGLREAGRGRRRLDRRGLGTYLTKNYRIDAPKSGSHHCCSPDDTRLPLLISEFSRPQPREGTTNG